MTGFSLSIKSQLKCQLLRGAFPDLFMQSSPFFSLSVITILLFSCMYHAMKESRLFADVKAYA